MTTGLAKRRMHLGSKLLSCDEVQPITANIVTWWMVTNQLWKVSLEFGACNLRQFCRVLRLSNAEKIVQLKKLQISHQTFVSSDFETNGQGQFIFPPNLNVLLACMVLSLSE